MNDSKIKRAFILLTCWVLVLFALAVSAAATPAAAIDEVVKFSLKADRENSRLLHVSLSFRVRKGEKVSINTLERTNHVGSGEGGVVIEMKAITGPEYSIEASTSQGGGWSVTPNVDGVATIPYLVSVTGANTPEDAGERREGAYGRAPVVVDACEVLMLPGGVERGDRIAESYELTFDAGPGVTVLVPWPEGREGEVYEIAGKSALLDNFIGWGPMAVTLFKQGGTEVAIGFAKDLRMSDADRKDYSQDLLALYKRLVDLLGPRKDLSRLSVLVADSRGGPPSSLTLKDSVVVYSSGTALEGATGGAAATALFELWNRWAVMPAIGGDARWLQEGLSGVYGYRVAALAGITSSTTAYGHFSGLYDRYLANPLSKTMTLEDAERAGNREFAAEKGAALCMSLDERLRQQSGGDRDIDWLLGRVFKDRAAGREYTLVDISEILETATGKSWDRYFDVRVRGTRVIPASEFSSSGFFGTGGGTTGKTLNVRGSGKSWILLVCALVVIFLIPLVFSTYVRRAVKLDMTMPRILPDDEEDDEER